MYLPIKNVCLKKDYQLKQLAMTEVYYFTYNKLLLFSSSYILKEGEGGGRISVKHVFAMRVHI